MPLHSCPWLSGSCLGDTECKTQSADHQWLGITPVSENNKHNSKCRYIRLFIPAQISSLITPHRYQWENHTSDFSYLMKQQTNEEDQQYFFLSHLPSCGDGWLHYNLGGAHNSCQCCHEHGSAYPCIETHMHMCVLTSHKHIHQPAVTYTSP